MKKPPKGHRNLCSVPDASPVRRFRDRRTWKVIGKLRGFKHCQANMSNTTRDISQFRSNRPASRAYDEHGLFSLHGHHAYGRHQIGIIRNNNGHVEQFLPRIVQKMSREIHIRAFLLHRMDFGNIRIGQRPGNPSPFSFSRALNRIPVHRQSLSYICHWVIARWQRHWPWRVDSFIGNGQVRERTPVDLGEKSPEMHFCFRQSVKGAQIYLLTGRRSWV